MTSSSSLRGSIGSTSWMQVLVYSLLLLRLSSFSHGISVPNICKSLNCFSPSDIAPPLPPPPSASIKCSNKQAPTQANGWNIYAPIARGELPSVADILADIRLCGILNAQTTTVFYSFAAEREDALKFAAANPNLQAKTISDLLPNSWYENVAKIPGIDQSYGVVQMAWTARNSQALAQASHGNTYCVVDGGVNIYTVPKIADKKELHWRGPHNVW